MAECVEDAATLQLVRDVGIDFAQRHYVGKPAPALPIVAGDAASRRPA